MPAAAIAANDARFGSSRSHFSALRPKPVMLLNTAGWFHITPTDSGTSPSFLRIAFFNRPP
jgi:hypothetical protein